MSTQGFIEQFEWRRQATMLGKLTYIPIDDILPRLSAVFPGFVPEDYVIVTGMSEAGKSRLTRFLFIKHVINMISKYKANIHVHYNSTEESLAKVESTFVQSWLFKNFGLDLSFYEIQHYKKPGETLSDEVVNKIKQGRLILENNIRPYVTMYHEIDGDNFFNKVMTSYANEGKFFDDFGNVVTPGSPFSTYQSDDPYAFRIIITDNINNLSEKSGNNKEKTIRDYSEKYCRHVLCKKMKAIVVNVQQQVGDKERIESNFQSKVTAEKLYPSNGALAQCTHTHRDATIILGIFKPQKFVRVMKTYCGYDVERNPGLTGIHVLKTRESKSRTSNILPVNHLPGDNFVELPKI